MKGSKGGMKGGGEEKTDDLLPLPMPFCLLTPL